MKLLILAAPFDHGKSGISAYIREVVNALTDAGHDLTLIVENSAQGEFKNHKLYVLPKFCDQALWSMLYILLVLPWRLKFHNYDRVLELAGNRRILCFTRIENRITLHDLSQYHVKAKYDIFRMFYIKHVLPFFVRRSATVVEAISQSTADDAVRFWRIPEGKIEVNYNGFSLSQARRNANNGADKTVLYVSRLEDPGKNHLNLLKGWELLPDSITNNYRLVLAGADWSGAEKIHSYARQSPKSSRIEFTGFLDRERLDGFYSGCSLFIFPSRFEGFGLPLVEAMASGAVCACSKTSSLGEIASSGAALTFDPESPEEIAQAIEQGLTNEQLRIELRQKGVKRADDFSWAKHIAPLVGKFDGHATVLGVRFLTVTMARALELVDISTQNTKSVPDVGCFVNADCFNQAFTNLEYSSLLKRAQYVFADGVGAEWAAKHLHTPVWGNVNGTDMLPLLCQKKHSMYLLGGAPGVAEKAKQNLEAKNPGLKIAGCRDGFFQSEAEEAAAVKAINDSGAEILLVAMGVPRQEKWILKHQENLHCRLAIGVGGLLDFASGRIPRAPSWLRCAKLEWTFRLHQEPIRLFKRYIIGNPLFIFRVLWYGSGAKKQ